MRIEATFQPAVADGEFVLFGKPCHTFGDPNQEFFHAQRDHSSRVKESRIKGYGVLAQRNPKLMVRNDGLLSWRNEAAKLEALTLVQPPPRMARD